MQSIILGIIAAAVLTLQALVINRLAGIPYPLWNPVQQSASNDAKTTH